MQNNIIKCKILLYEGYRYNKNFKKYNKNKIIESLKITLFDMKEKIKSNIYNENYYPENILSSMFLFTRTSLPMGFISLEEQNFIENNKKYDENSQFKIVESYDYFDDINNFDDDIF